MAVVRHPVEIQTAPLPEIGIRALEKIAKALDVNLQQFFDGF
jgi:hypothetical protein